MTKPEYLTVDLDNPTRFDIVRSWYYVDRHGAGETHGRLSRSGAGVHIRDRPVLPQDVTVNEYHRRMAGDDRNRIDKDMENDIEANQVLWNSPYEWTYDLDQLVQWYRGRTVIPPEVDP